MSQILCTIPGVVAAHVLGDAAVTLGEGDLNLVHPDPAVPTLALSVGAAGFSLEKGTVFGTIVDDPRAYVFSPKIEGVHGGYVKLTLPEGTLEEGSRFSDLQTRFEEILVSRGFLQPASDDPAQRVKDAIARKTTEPLVHIPAVVAMHVVGETANVLAEGELSLILGPSGTPEPAETDPVLTLTVAQAAFPLHKSTMFGTLANDERTYVFTPQLTGTTSGFVCIVLPDGVSRSGSQLAERQGQFEAALVEVGLLKDGVEAAADEFGRGVREDAAQLAERIRAARASYLTQNPPTAVPEEFSKVTHTVAGGLASGTQSVANVAHSVAGAVASAASYAGAWIAGTFVPTDHGATAQLNAAERSVSSVVGGVKGGAGEVVAAATTTAGDVIENEYGKEARQVAGDVGGSVGNVSAVAGDVAIVTSGAALAVAGLQGAAGAQNEQQAEKDAEKKVETPAA